MNKLFFEGKQVLLMGLGRFGGGVDVVKFLCGTGADITATDIAGRDKLADSISRLDGLDNIEYHLGSHERADFERADIVIVNPAVRPDNEYVRIAQEAGALITSQIEIFFELCPALIIGITGANGKSTTAALTAHLLRAAIGRRQSNYRKVWLSGNIGNEPLLAVIDEIAQDNLVVLELSSFQLEQLARLRRAPDVALLTNLTANHLDRYGTFEAYRRSKKTIFQYQKVSERRPAVSIFNADDEIGCEWFAKLNGRPGRVCLKFSTEHLSNGIRNCFALPGRANLANLAAAVCVARHFGVDDESIIASLPGFKPLPHRLDPVAEIDGVRWYNDSKATTPVSAIAALEAFEQPVIIIAGGYDKHISLEPLGETIAKRAKAAILIGRTARKIADAIEKKLAPESIKVEVAASLNDAVDSAGELAVSGDVVLLSPGCASYDMFDNFQQRGRRFTELVKARMQRLSGR